MPSAPKTPRPPPPASRPINSRENRWLKMFRAALHQGPLPDTPWVAVEGPHLVEEALRSGLEIPALLLRESDQDRFSPLVATVCAAPPRAGTQARPYRHKRSRRAAPFHA